MYANKAGLKISLKEISKNELLDLKDIKTKLKNDDGYGSGFFGEKPTAL